MHAYASLFMGHECVHTLAEHQIAFVVESLTITDRGERSADATFAVSLSLSLRGNDETKQLNPTPPINPTKRIQKVADRSIKGK